MATRRKAGSVRKVAAAPRKKASASRARASAPARRASTAREASGAAAAVVGAFPADCTIAQADEMKARLARVVGKPACVRLDLAGIRRIDTAGLQVLTAFIRERRAAGRDVECTGATEAFLLTADLLGLGALFASEGVAAASGAGNA